MTSKTLIIFLLFLPLIFGSCRTRNRVILRPDPEQRELPHEVFITGEILASKGGAPQAALPDWVNSFIHGGIRTVEQLNAHSGRYVFIGRNRGNNFIALNRWSENFTVFHDFPRLAAARIENRLFSAATLYPDDEYGDFFVALIRLASDAEYPGALIEDTYWIKMRITPENSYEETGEPEEALELYDFFVLISIDRTTMQNHIRRLMSEAEAAATPTRAQRASINRVQQIFFEDF